jgi:hypothetical protein
VPAGGAADEGAAGQGRQGAVNPLAPEAADLVSIQELLGHPGLSATAVYLHMEAAHLQGAVAPRSLGG